MAAPETTNNVTVRRLSSLMSQLWTKIKNALDGKVPTSRTVNGKALSGDISLTASDVEAAPSTHGHGNIAPDGSDGEETHDTSKFLRADGQWMVPPQGDGVLSITVNNTTAYGFKIATTSTVSTANYPTVSVTAVVSIRQWNSGTTIGSPWSFEGFLELFHRRNGSGGTESYFGRLYTTTPFDGSTNKGWIVFAVRNGTETIDWYIAPHEQSQSRSFQYMSLSFFTLSKFIDSRATCNIGLSLRTTALSTYLNRWNSVKIAFLPCDASNVGSSTTPAYVDSNGQLKACKKLVQAVTSIDTSSMDPDVLYVM